MTSVPAQQGKGHHDTSSRSCTELQPAAGFLRRLFATLVDMLLFCGLTALLMLPAGAAIQWQGGLQQFDRLVRDLSDPRWLSHASGVAGLWIALWWCYFAVGWGVAGATPGKWVLGLRVVDHRDHWPIGVPRAMLRLCAYCVSSLTCGWGHLLVLVRSDHRALHDILAGTRVVRRSRWRLPKVT